MIIGVTGIIGSGKSTAAVMLSECLDAVCIDVDKAGHVVLAKNNFVRFWLKILFGSVERSIIAGQVFSSPVKLFLLNTLTHPFMRRSIRRTLRDSSKSYVLDAALLFQMRLDKYCDKVVFVEAKKSLIYARLSAAGLTRQQIARRLAANQKVFHYKKRADKIVLNNGTKTALRKNIEKIGYIS
ncbi:dephospho-CoA kinase [Candidatus Termititenax dinenymphae]|uniref:Dephospho-CoA kinase n=1 Tax=Candidatus Termititenax dinenymphae TaxID=2218523 RepID=A0A388TLH4_9BACT|nr:dephospho-CoA kinase [Candidatus Termititenax dinenymphae]